MPLSVAKRITFLLFVTGCGARTETRETRDEAAPVDASADAAPLPTSDGGLVLRCFGASRTCRCELTREPGPRGACGPATFGHPAHCCRARAGAPLCRCQDDALPCLRDSVGCACGGPFPHAGSEAALCTAPAGTLCCKLPTLGLCTCGVHSCATGTVVGSCAPADALLACTGDEDAVATCD